MINIEINYDLIKFNHHCSYSFTTVFMYSIESNYALFESMKA